MSVRYDPLVTRLLARQIRSRWMGAEVRSLGMDPDRSAASLRFGDGSALVALFDREAGFVVPSDSDPLGDDGVRVTRFGRLTLSAIDVPEDERSIALWLDEPDGTRAAGVAFELHTNRWNVLCLSPAPADGPDDGWRVRYALWTHEVGGRRIGPGEPYAPALSDRLAIDALPDAPEWRAWIEEDDGAERGRVLRTWAWTSALNIEWLLGDEGDPERMHERYAELHPRPAGASGPGRPGATVEPPRVWLADRRWGAQPYPHSLGRDDAAEQPDTFSAMSAALERAGGLEAVLESAAGSDDGTAENESERLAARLKDRLGRERKKAAALARQLDAAGPPEEARELGQILLVRKEAVPRGEGSVTLEAFDGSERVIELDPALDAVANAERYFDEGRRRERALERLPAEIEKAESRIEALAGGLERLEAEGSSDALWKLVGGRPASSRKGGSRGRAAADEEDRLPYSRLVSSGGLEIRVGRGAKDNDALTFRHSSPDDIWMHASQVSGAHVVLRWGRRDDNPPQRDLLEAAVAAAVNSGARHSGAVAVAWTRRKYVRKPRKAPPGAVIPDRVQTLMVEPDEELVQSLREAAEP